MLPTYYMCFWKQKILWMWQKKVKTNWKFYFKYRDNYNMKFMYHGWNETGLPIFFFG